VVPRGESQVHGKGPRENREVRLKVPARIKGDIPNKKRGNGKNEKDFEGKRIDRAQPCVGLPSAPGVESSAAPQASEN